MKLNINQEKFCLKYHECGNASEAYRYAYPNSQKWKDEAVWPRASSLLNKATVVIRVKELQEEQKAKSGITKDRVLAEYAKIAFCSIAHLHNTWIERKEFESLTEGQKSAIKSISTRIRKQVINDELFEIEEIKVELFDKLKALDGINKMLGYDAAQKVDVNVSGTLSDERFIELMEKSK